MRRLTQLSDTGIACGGLSRLGLAASLLLHIGVAGGVLAANAWLDDPGHAALGMAGTRVMEVSFVTPPSPALPELPQPVPVRNPEPVVAKEPAKAPPVKIADDAVRKADPVEEKVAAAAPPLPAKQAAGTDGAEMRGTGRGAVAGANDTYKSYADDLLRHIAKHKHYPASALKRREQGVAVVQFSLDGTGRLISLHLMESSGHRTLDRAAMQTLRSAQPLPLPPDGLYDMVDGFTLPVRFSLTNGARL